MAFCNKDCKCGSACYRLDEHGGMCKCADHFYSPDRSANQEIKVVLKVYAIRSHTGEWYQTYAQRGRAGWVKDLADARLFTQIGPAHAKVTTLAFPGATPELVEFMLTPIQVIDQTERIEKVNRKKALAMQTKRQKDAAERLLRAEGELQAAQEKLNKLKKG